MTQSATARRLAVLGVGLVLAGLVTGFLQPVLANPRMGLSSHLAGVFGGVLLIALAGIWHWVRLGAGAERGAFALLAFGTVANWATVLLAAVWGAGAQTMPLAARGMSGAAWQEQVIGALLITLSLAVLGGLGLVLRGLLAARD